MKTEKSKTKRFNAAEYVGTVSKMWIKSVKDYASRVDKNWKPVSGKIKDAGLDWHMDSIKVDPLGSYCLQIWHTKEGRTKGFIPVLCFPSGHVYEQGLFVPGIGERAFDEAVEDGKRILRNKYRTRVRLVRKDGH